MSGLVFLCVLALLLALSVAVFQKRFTPAVMVQLHTDHVGNQLQEASDVKVRGLVVGEVRKVETSGHGAVVSLALDPDQVGAIPRNVSARLLPKTLFGERYVDLVLPANPSRAGLHEGDTISQDRSSTAIELEQVFDDLLPLLRTVRPQDLSATLNAMATALEGRGEQLGQNLRMVDDYLKQLQPHLPTLTDDISRLADVASTYADAAPDLVGTLRNLAVTSQTVATKQSTVAAFLTGTTGLARTATGVLTDDGDRIIRVGAVSRPTLEVLAKYAPEYPCLAQGLDRYRSRINDAFSGNALHITLEVVPQRSAYVPGEEPSWQDHRGPSCYGLPAPGWDQSHPYPGNHFADGTHGAPTSLPPGSVRTAAAGDGGTGGPSPLADPASGQAGTAAEQAVTDALLAPVLGLEPDQVPDISNLLVGPLARGTQVTQR
ncbi:MAG TPA: MCE family protein [Actinomycetales bacterium]|nr:MCE family protein [Actinomycetales bacterium]